MQNQNQRPQRAIAEGGWQRRSGRCVCYQDSISWLCYTGLMIADYTVEFPDHMDDRAWQEAAWKGWFPSADIRLHDGTAYTCTFYSPVRLAQDVQHEFDSGQTYFCEPNTVVIPEVTEEGIRAAIKGLAAQDFIGLAAQK